MNISVGQLIAAGFGPTQARLFHPHLQPALNRFEITNPARAAAFLAQCHVESQGFTRLEENLLYTTAARIAQIWPSRFAGPAEAIPYVRNPERLANRVYAGRLGNGGEAGGDGWRFRGRGLKQLTGRANYARAAEALVRPYLAEPGLVREPEHAVLTAAWFWHMSGCNPLADVNRIDAITRRINGPAMLEAAQRRGRTARALRAFGMSGPH